jgi:predicted nucleotidyltransferase
MALLKSVFLGRIYGVRKRPESDVDILIDIARPAKIDLFDLIMIEDELTQELNTKVDLVIKSNLKPIIGNNILSEVEYL